MQHDLNRLKRRKARRNKILSLFVLCIVIALAMVMMRACSDQFAEPYNKSYQPMDTLRKQGNNP